jgi:hypothetical protein
VIEYPANLFRNSQNIPVINDLVSHITLGNYFPSLELRDKNQTIVVFEGQTILIKL